MRLLVAVSLLALGACASGAGSTLASAPVAAAASAPAPAPAPGPPAAEALQPVGTYSFSTEFGGNPITGTLVITNTGGTWGGRLTSDAIPEIPVTAVSVEGQTMKVTVETPNGSVVITMTFTGRDYTGSYDLGGITAVVTGKKLS